MEYLMDNRSLQATTNHAKTAIYHRVVRKQREINALEKQLTSIESYECYDDRALHGDVLVAPIVALQSLLDLAAQGELSRKYLDVLLKLNALIKRRQHNQKTNSV